MPPEARHLAHLWDMREAAREIVTAVGERSLEAFSGDRVLMLAVERSLEIIGKAARRVPPEFQDEHPGIPWREIIGQRNILAHEYGQIDHEILFKTVQDDLPDLIEALARLLPA